LEEEAEVSAVRGATSEAWDESIGTSDGKDLVAAEKSRFEVRRTGDVQKEKQPLNLEFEVSFAEALKELGARELSGSTPSRVQGDRALEVLEYDQFFEVLAGRLTSASEEEQSVNIRLYPKELGELKISVSVKADVVQLKLETETVLSQRIIEEQLPVLKKALESQGLQLGEFSLGTNFFNHQGSYETRLELASEFSKLMSLNGRSEEGIPSENPPEVAYTKPKDGLVDYRV
jgi:flagellar hook-length control protein FliK